MNRVACNLLFRKRSTLMSLATALVAAMSCVATTPARAQIFGPRPVIVLPIPSPKPATPQVSAPPSGVQRADIAVAQTVVLRWYQPELVVAQPPVTPTQFIVCLKDPASPCDWPTNALHTWAGAATSTTFFTRVPQYSGSPYTTGPRLLQGYHYTATIPIATARYDQQLKWSVGACTTTTAASCSFAAPGNVWYSTKNIEGDDPQAMSGATSNGRAITSSFAFRNNGSTDTGLFDVQVQALETLNAGGRCERNPAMADATFPSVVLDDGRRVFPNAIPAGAAIDAILRPAGDMSPVITYSGLSLAPGGATFVAGQPRDQFAAIHSFTWRSTTEMQRTYVIIGMPDSADRVREFNELDNGKAACLTVSR